MIAFELYGKKAFDARNDLAIYLTRIERSDDASAEYMFDIYLADVRAGTGFSVRYADFEGETIHARLIRQDIDMSWATDAC